MGLLTSMFQRSLENPSTPLSAPDDWLFDSLGSFRASSGVNVNRETALTLDAYWRCIALISGDVAKMPISIFKRTQQGDTTVKTEDDNHPAYPLLKYEVSDEISAIDWKRVMMVHALAEGNGYTYIVRNQAGEPMELWPLSPMKTYPVREGMRLWYVTEIGNSEQRKIPSEDMWHLKGMSFDGLVGYSVVAKMRETLGEGLAAQNFCTIFFRNNARPNVVLTCPNKLKPEAKTNLRESWERMHVGLENAHRTAVLDGGLDLKVIQHNARDSQLMELRQFNRTAIANFFGVPVHKVAERDGNSSYGSLEQENEAYIEDGAGLGYWLPAFAVECWRKLTSDWQQRRMTHSIEFNTRRLLRANLQARTAYYIGMLSAGVFSPNEVREEEGYDPREGGDQYMTPLNMQVGDKLPGQDDEPPADDDKPKLPPPKGKPKRLGWDGHSRIRDNLMAQAVAVQFADGVRRLVKRLGHQAERAAKKPADFLAWLDRVRADEGPTGAEIMGPCCRTLEALQGVERNSYAFSYAIIDSIREKLLEVSGQVGAKELADSVKRHMTFIGAMFPECLAAAEIRAVDEPGRSIDDALAILDQIPERRPGQILPLFPVNMQVPYTLTAEKLRDLWSSGAIDTQTIKLRTLIATQDWIDKDVLRCHLKDEETPVETLNIEGSPHDMPYVVSSGGLYFIYDGHHRLTAMWLRAVAKTKAYVWEES